MKINIGTKNKSSIERLTSYKLKINDKAIRSDISMQELNKLAMSRVDPTPRDLVIALHNTMSDIVDSNKSTMADVAYCNSLVIDSSIMVASSLDEVCSTVNQLSKEQDDLKILVTELKTSRNIAYIISIVLAAIIVVMLFFFMFHISPNAAKGVVDGINGLVGNSTQQQQQQRYREPSSDY